MHNVAKLVEEGLHLVVVEEGGLVIGWLAMLDKALMGSIFLSVEVVAICKEEKKTPFSPKARAKKLFLYHSDCTMYLIAR